MKSLRLPLLLAVPLVPAAFAQTSGDVVLENRFLRRAWSVSEGRLRTVAIENKLAGKSAELAGADEFRLRISQDVNADTPDRLLTAADFRVVATETAPDKSAVTFRLENADMKADLRVTLAADDFYLRKRLTITALKPFFLEQVQPEALALRGATQPYTLKKITSEAPWQWKPGLGQPLYGMRDATFWGVEFPAASNTVSAGDKLDCGYLYGRRLEPGAPYAAYPAVMGVADDPAYVQDAFFDYIDRTRARPFRLQVQYNSWFDFGPGVNKTNFAASVSEIHKQLVEKRGVPPLASYVVDDGWQDCSASWADGNVWPVNAKFDRDLSPAFATVKAAESRLGLWLSPCCAFGAQRKVKDLQKDGYEALPPFMSIAGPRYMDALENRMADLTRQGVNFWKLDGIFGHLNERVFELHGARYGLPELPYLGAGEFTPGDKRLNDAKYDELKTYYMVAATERLMKNFDRLGKIDPKVYILISNAAYLSPWWLQHADASWIINSADGASGKGRSGVLVYRDAILRQIAVDERTQFPMNALFNHEPKKTDSDESPAEFRSYLYMALSRGTGFMEFYLKPAKLRSHDWDVLAEGMLWAQMTGPDFKRSRMHGGDPKQGEAYGFTGWSAGSGYLSFHNPSDKPVVYRVKLDRALGLIPGSGPFAVASPLENGMRGVKPAAAYGDTLEIALEPLEVRILNFGKTAPDFSRLVRLRKGADAAYSAQ